MTDGRLVATDNGPDADAPEELNLLEKGGHYGFPYQFSDWTKKPYPYTPEPPPGISFTPPVINLGPNGGFEAGGKPVSTFDPHSSPAGILQLTGDAYPPPYQNSLIAVRFGNLLKKDRDVGFDLLMISLQAGESGKPAATIKTLLSPLARPIDVIEWKPGHLLIAEYGRGTTYAAGLGQPGRILEFYMVYE